MLYYIPEVRIQQGDAMRRPKETCASFFYKANLAVDEVNQFINETPEGRIPSDAKITLSFTNVMLTNTAKNQEMFVATFLVRVVCGQYGSRAAKLVYYRVSGAGSAPTVFITNAIEKVVAPCEFFDELFDEVVEHSAPVATNQLTA